MAVVEFNAENFEEKVLHSEKPVLIDFWAVWCGPCGMMAPVIEEIAEEYADSLLVGKVNCDENMELAQSYDISGIPAFLLFQDGKMVEKALGVMPKEELVEKIKPYLS